MSISSKPKLLEDIIKVMRLKHYALSTERTYCDWIKRFVKFHKMQDRTELLLGSEKKIEAFLSFLAVDSNVAASTQNQAMIYT